MQKLHHRHFPLDLKMSIMFLFLLSSPLKQCELKHTVLEKGLFVTSQRAHICSLHVFSLSNMLKVGKS